MQDIDFDKIAQIIRDVAADKIAPRFRALAKSDVRAKSSPTDLVTIADEEAEIELTRILTGVLPGSVVLGEEAVSSEKTSRDILKQTESPVWIVDPVDGTGNFAGGNPIFGTMVSLIQGGERVGAWIYQIPKDKMVMAGRGSGITINGTKFTQPMRHAPDADFKTMHAFIGRKFMPPKIRPYVEEKIKMMGDATTYMCCAFEYVELLEGDAAFSVYKRIEPWDHMAGALLLEESGFYIRKWDGTPYTAQDLEGGLVNAPSEEIWTRAFEAFLKEPLSKFGQ